MSEQDRDLGKPTEGSEFELQWPEGETEFRLKIHGVSLKIKPPKPEPLVPRVGAEKAY